MIPNRTRRMQNENSVLANRCSYIAKKLNSIDLGIEKGFMIEKLKNRLRTGIVRFAYLKANNEIRVAFGTLNPIIIKHTLKGNGESPEKHHACAYFDIQAAWWRSFRWENIIAILPD